MEILKHEDTKKLQGGEMYCKNAIRSSSMQQVLNYRLVLNFCAGADPSLSLSLYIYTYIHTRHLPQQFPCLSGEFMLKYECNNLDNQVCH